MTTEAFVAGYTRFCARRGFPAVMWSDNGTNFVGTERELKEAYQDLFMDDTIDKQLAVSHSVDWRFNPSGAPHFEGP